MPVNETIQFELDSLANEGKILSRHVEILLKYLLLVNGHIPHGYDDLKKRISQGIESNTESFKRIQRFITCADELFSGISKSICSCSVSEVIAVFGATLFTPKFTVTIELPNLYDQSSFNENWDDIADPSGFPIQLVQHFANLSKLYDVSPSNVWLLLRVDESTAKDVPSHFRIDRRLSVSPKGCHLKVCLDVISSAEHSVNCSGFCPLSPLSRSCNIASTDHDNSGFFPFSPNVPVKSPHNTTSCSETRTNCVYYASRQCLKGFR